MARTKQAATKTSGKRQSTISRGESSQARRKNIKDLGPNDPEKFQSMNFWAERGFAMQEASDAFKATVRALGWEQLVQQPSFFYASVVREFYAGIVKTKEGKPQYYSEVRGVPVKFDSIAINECLGASYHGLVFEKNVAKWGKKEMETVKKNITISGTPWEPCSLNEFKVKRSSLNHDAMVWFNFVKHSLLPTSHTTNVEKERMMLLDAILGKKDVDVGRLICREIMVSHGKIAGYLFFPCLITNLCIKAGVEMKGEKKSYPVAAFPTVLKVKKPVAASGDATMLQQYMLQQKAIWEFQRKQHLWLVSALSRNLIESAELDAPSFPDWVVDEEAIDDVLFEDELNEGEEEEVVADKKRKRSGQKESRKEVKRGKRPVGVVEEEDLLETEGDGESLSEGEKQENIKLMKELNKESDEEDPTSEEEDEFHEAAEKLDEATPSETQPNPIPQQSMPPQTIPQQPTSPQPKQPTPTPSQPPQPETTQPENIPPPQTQPPQEPTIETLPKDTAVSAVAPGSENAAATEVVTSPAKKLRTKKITRKQKMAQVEEDQNEEDMQKEKEAEKLTEEEEAMMDATVNSVMGSLGDAAVADAAAMAAAEAQAKKMADFERRSKAALEFVIAQKKASGSVAAPVVADTGAVLHHSTAAAPEPATAQATPKAKPAKVYQKKTMGTRKSPRMKPGSPSS